MPKKSGYRTKTTFGREEDLMVLLARGCNTQQAAEALGLHTRKSLYTWCVRTGNLALWNKFPPLERNKRRYKGRFTTLQK